MAPTFLGRRPSLVVSVCGTVPLINYIIYLYYYINFADDGVVDGEGDVVDNTGEGQYASSPSMCPAFLQNSLFSFGEPNLTSGA